MFRVPSAVPQAPPCGVWNVAAPRVPTEPESIGFPHRGQEIGRGEVIGGRTLCLLVSVRFHRGLAVGASVTHRQGPLPSYHPLRPVEE